MSSTQASFQAKQKRNKSFRGRKQWSFAIADEPSKLGGWGRASTASALYSLPYYCCICDHYLSSSWRATVSRLLVENFLNPGVVMMENSLRLKLIAAMKDPSRSPISSVNQRNEERNGARTRAVNRHSCLQWPADPLWPNSKLLTPLPRPCQPAKRMHFTCKSCRKQSPPTQSLCPVEKMAHTGDKMGRLHYSVPHVHLIVSIAIALTANKHNLIAHQLFDGRKTGNLEMILRWETSLLSFCMRFCFHSSLPSPSLQWLYFSTNSISKYYSQYKIF